MNPSWFPDAVIQNDSTRFSWVTLRDGDAIILPPGFFHFVYTSKDTIAFAGSFLYDNAADMSLYMHQQLEVVDELPSLFPFYRKMYVRVLHDYYNRFVNSNHDEIMKLKKTIIIKIIEHVENWIEEKNDKNNMLYIDDEISLLLQETNSENYSLFSEKFQSLINYYYNDKPKTDRRSLSEKDSNKIDNDNNFELARFPFMIINEDKTLRNMEKGFELIEHGNMFPIIKENLVIDEKLSDNMFFHSNKDNCVYLSCQDRDDLRNNKWINDSHVDFFVLWAKRYECTDTLDVNVLNYYKASMIRSGITSMIIKNPTTTGAKLSRDYIKQKLIMFPVNKDMNHWYLICFFGADTLLLNGDNFGPKICIIDSLQHDDIGYYDEAVTSLKQFLAKSLMSDHGNDIDIWWNNIQRINHSVVTPSHYQNNGNDCGIYTCYHMWLLYKHFVNIEIMPSSDNELMDVVSRIITIQPSSIAGFRVQLSSLMDYILQEFKTIYDNFNYLPVNCLEAQESTSSKKKTVVDSEENIDTDIVSECDENNLYYYPIDNYEYPDDVEPKQNDHSKRNRIKFLASNIVDYTYENRIAMLEKRIATFEKSVTNYSRKFEELKGKEKGTPLINLETKKKD
jgi:hypothetical protein